MTRRRDIERAKGLAITLVVFGHLVARAGPANVAWYEPLRRTVYAFHMPFFLYLSGLVAVSAGIVLAPAVDWLRIIKRRAQRLLVPFFGIGGTVVLAKCAAANIIFVDNVPRSLAAGFGDLFWHTAASPALSIWYLWVLFAVSVLSMVLLGGRQNRLPWLLVASVLLYALPVPALAYLDRFCHYAIFYSLGVAAGLAGAAWERWMARLWAPALGMLLLYLAAIAGFGAAWPQPLVLLSAGALAMPALHGMLRFTGEASPRLLLYLGRYSFVIYLFNTLFIGLTKGVLRHCFSWDGGHFFAFAAALMCAGIAGPIAVKRYLLKYSPALDRLTD